MTENSLSKETFKGCVVWTRRQVETSLVNPITPFTIIFNRSIPPIDSNSGIISRGGTLSSSSVPVSMAIQWYSDCTADIKNLEYSSSFFPVQFKAKKSWADS